MRNSLTRRFWQFVHNVIAHPLLEFLPRGAGSAFHDWTGGKAFQGEG
jgi:hypothetical protein